MLLLVIDSCCIRMTYSSLELSHVSSMSMKCNSIYVNLKIGTQLTVCNQTLPSATLLDFQGAKSRYVLSID